MPGSFDPYRKWLGIPPGEQPPHHYRLLGISLFEDDCDVIESAADQRMAHLRSFQIGPHSALSQRLLNEVSAARICLLDPSRKARYDAELRQRLAAPPTAARLPAGPPAATSAMIESASPTVAANPPPARRIVPPVRRRRPSLGPIAGITALLAAIIAGILIWAKLEPGPTAIRTPLSEPQPSAPALKLKPQPTLEEALSNGAPLASPPEIIVAPMQREQGELHESAEAYRAPVDDSSDKPEASPDGDAEQGSVSEPADQDSTDKDAASSEKPKTAGGGAAKRPRVSTNGRLAPASEPGLPPGVRLLRDRPYGKKGNGQLLDLYLPMKFAASVPLVIWIHGGGWQQSSKESWPVIFLIDKAYAVASINYRLSDEAKFPAQIHDCKAAVRWLRANAKRYGIDPDRFGVWGSSAGGHLAALLGTSAGAEALEGTEGADLKTSSRVQAVCDWCGPTDLEQFSRFQASFEDYGPDFPNRLVTKLLGGPVDEVKDLAASASPITFVSVESPPFLILHGDQDNLVPPEQSELLHRALEQARTAVELRRLPGRGHEMFDDLASLRLVEEFFNKTLWKSDAGQLGDDVRLIATYTHHAGNLAPAAIEFYSNGRLGSPESAHTWMLRGNQLALCWYKPDAKPFGVWVDICTLSKDGKTYQGRNQDRAPVRGDKADGDNLRSADRPKAPK